MAMTCPIPPADSVSPDAHVRIRTTSVGGAEMHRVDLQFLYARLSRAWGRYAPGDAQYVRALEALAAAATAGVRLYKDQWKYGGRQAYAWDGHAWRFTAFAGWRYSRPYFQYHDTVGQALLELSSNWLRLSDAERARFWLAAGRGCE